MMGRILGNHPAIFIFKELHFFGTIWSNNSISILDRKQQIDLLSRLLCIQENPELAKWQTDVPNSTNFDDASINSKVGFYDAKKEVELNYAYPIVVGYKNNFGIGYKFNFKDPLSLKTVDFSISYTPNQWKNDVSS